MSMTPTSAQALLALIEGDLLTAEGTPILTFLQALSTAAGDPVKVAAAWVALQGAVVGSLPGLETTLIQQLISAITGKLQAALAKAQGH